MAMRWPTDLRLNACARSCPATVALALVEHLDVAAQRDRGDRVLGAVAAAAHPQRPAETDREAQHLDPEPARDPEVPELVEGHQHAEADDHPPHRSDEITHGE